MNNTVILSEEKGKDDQKTAFKEEVFNGLSKSPKACLQSFFMTIKEVKSFLILQTLMNTILQSVNTISLQTIKSPLSPKFLPTEKLILLSLELVMGRRQRFSSKKS